MGSEQKHSPLVVEHRVAEALHEGQPVVALESTIISHGMPYPKNLETALNVEDIVKKQGAVPATIGIIGGRLTVGLDNEQIEQLALSGSSVTKTSRRDIPLMMSLGHDGATTVAATMIIAAMAGIRVMATGGIGGVHRGVEETMDISADLQELACNTMVVVCSGIKSVLDIGRTIEYLETVGVPLIGYRTGMLPAFYARESEYPVDYRLEEAVEIAKTLDAKLNANIDGAMLVTNPVPKEYAFESSRINSIIEEAITAMNIEGISGKEATPFLLARIADETGGRSLEANIELVKSNASLAADVAVQYSQLVKGN
ncbi:MAG: pseudouridine-5-phosphate glycosidase [Woeseia sp.]|nr:pseudouridine-5-phosphate glycosidase [Woeseia sp.]|tara:strand:- start:931 stop:1872 length:942 start_codon:yes stop_codon:yes gene_type:complete